MLAWRDNTDRDLMLSVITLLVAGASGFGLAAIGASTELGPVVVAGLPLLALAATAVLVEPRIAVLAVFAILPAGFTQVPGVPLQLVEAVSLGAAVIVALRRVGTGQAPLGWIAPVAWLVALLCWAVASLPAAVDPDLGVQQTLALLGGVVFVTLVLAVITTARDVRRLMAVFVVVSAGIALSSISSGTVAQSHFGGGVVTGRATGIFTEPNQLGAMCALAALVCIGLTLAARRPIMKLLGTSAGFVLVAGLLLSFSRGAWIGFVLGIIVLVVMLPRARRGLIILSVPLVALAASLGAFAPGNPAVSIVTDRLTSTVNVRNPYDQRPAIWREALREIRESPLTGNGPGSFPVAAARSGSEAETVEPDHAHNLLLTWGAEVGVPAMLILIGFAIHVGTRAHAASRRLRPGTRDYDRATLAGLTAAAASIAGQGVVDYVMRGPVVFYAALAVLAALLAFTRVARPAPLTARPGPLPDLPAPHDDPEPTAISWKG